MDKMAKSIDGRELELTLVISESLKFIADKDVEKLTEQVGKINKNRIRWVLTVPALWTED